MKKSFKKFFVSIFILIFSLVCLANGAVFTSACVYPDNLYTYDSFLDSDELCKILSAKTEYDKLKSLCKDTLCYKRIPQDLLEALQAQYSLVCKNLFYLLKNSSQEFCDEVFHHLNYVAMLISDFKINLGNDLVSECYEDSVKELYSEVVKQCGLESCFLFNKESLNLFGAILIYSYVSNI